MNHKENPQCLWRHSRAAAGVPSPVSVRKSNQGGGGGTKMQTAHSSLHRSERSAALPGRWWTRLTAFQQPHLGLVVPLDPQS